MSISMPALFLVTALLYAMVGFGGGSTYNALLVLAGTDYRILPTVALICNIIVVTGGVWRFRQSGTLPFSRTLPFLYASVPAAWIGGRLPISEFLFIGLLGTTLFLSGAHLLVSSLRKKQNDIQDTRDIGSLLTALIGGGIGLLSGLVGIGGGIFLAPVLYFMRWGRPQEIAAACSLFILANSMSGLTGQLTKLYSSDLTHELFAYWPLALSVLIGGQIGSWLGALKVPANTVRLLTALLILFVSIRLLLRWFAMMD